LFASVIQRAGGDPVSLILIPLLISLVLYQIAVKRAIQKLIVQLPTQSPPPDETTLSPATLKTLREAQTLQKTMHDSYIAQDHLLRALLKDPSIAAALKELGLNEATLKTAIEQIRGNRRVESKSAEQGFDALQKYAVDLTALAEEGKLDPVIGRDNEIRRAIRILCRRYSHLLVRFYPALSHYFTTGQRTIRFSSASLVSARQLSLKALPNAL
jgi:ATP-dependent Clp protease ATP-binding subunit ClpB